MNMQYEWDEGKRQQAWVNRDIDFTDAERFRWDNANIMFDERRDYKETRLVATGFIDEDLYCYGFYHAGRYFEDNKYEKGQ